MEMDGKWVKNGVGNGSGLLSRTLKPTQLNMNRPSPEFCSCSNAAVRCMFYSEPSLLGTLPAAPVSFQPQKQPGRFSTAAQAPAPSFHLKSIGLACQERAPADPTICCSLLQPRAAPAVTQSSSEKIRNHLSENCLSTCWKWPDTERI